MRGSSETIEQYLQLPLYAYGEILLRTETESAKILSHRIPKKAQAFENSKFVCQKQIYDSTQATFFLPVHVTKRLWLLSLNASPAHYVHTLLSSHVLLAPFEPLLSPARDVCDATSTIRHLTRSAGLKFVLLWASGIFKNGLDLQPTNGLLGEFNSVHGLLGEFFGIFGVASGPSIKELYSCASC